MNNGMMEPTETILTNIEPWQVFLCLLIIATVIVVIGGIQDRRNRNKEREDE